MCTHAHTHTDRCTHANAHTHVHARTHTHTHTQIKTKCNIPVQAPVSSDKQNSGKMEFLSQNIIDVVIVTAFIFKFVAVVVAVLICNMQLRLFSTLTELRLILLRMKCTCIKRFCSVFSFSFQLLWGKNQEHYWTGLFSTCRFRLVLPAMFGFAFKIK